MGRNRDIPEEAVEIFYDLIGRQPVIDDWKSFCKTRREEYESATETDNPRLWFVNNQWLSIEDSELEWREAIYDFDSPLKAFNYIWSGGFYPPPELLDAISGCYTDYSIHFGKMSAEEAFFGKPVKGQGNYAARTKPTITGNERTDQVFHELMRKYPERTLISIAIEVHENHGASIEPESIRRNYNRLRGKRKRK